MALLHSGSIVAFGSRFPGAPDPYGATRVPSFGGVPVQDIAASYERSFALLANGSIISWGMEPRHYDASGKGGMTVVKLAPGNSHLLALRKNGSVLAWGPNENGECDIPLRVGRVRQLAAGWGHSMALRDNGRVHGWGSNDFGQLDVPDAIRDPNQRRTRASLRWQKRASSSSSVRATMAGNFDEGPNIGAIVGGVVGGVVGVTLIAAGILLYRRSRKNGGESGSGAVDLAGIYAPGNESLVSYGPAAVLADKQPFNTIPPQATSPYGVPPSYAMAPSNEMPLGANPFPAPSNEAYPGAMSTTSYDSSFYAKAPPAVPNN